MVTFCAAAAPDISASAPSAASIFRIDLPIETLSLIGILLNHRAAAGRCLEHVPAQLNRRIPLGAWMSDSIGIDSLMGAWMMPRAYSADMRERVIARVYLQNKLLASSMLP